MKVDRTSLLVEVAGEAKLGDIEARLVGHELTLDVDASAHDWTVREWIERGAPGARDAWSDPADQLLAAFEATLADGRALSVRPAPRRSVGPDLLALVLGCGGRFATLTRAHVRVHRVDAQRPSAPFAYPRDPAVTADEQRLLDAIAHELSRT